MTWMPPRSDDEPVVTPDLGSGETAQVTPAVDLLTALARVCATTPERIVTRHRQRALCYRELLEVVEHLIPVTRSQQMDDGSAVVAAIFARIPELASENDHEIVASVISGALGRIWTDCSDVARMSDSVVKGQFGDSGTSADDSIRAS